LIDGNIGEAYINHEGDLPENKQREVAASFSSLDTALFYSFPVIAALSGYCRS
jgi:hypothetical protein